jgi:hypothetical protein
LNAAGFGPPHSFERRADKNDKRASANWPFVGLNHAGSEDPIYFFFAFFDFFFFAMVHPPVRLMTRDDCDAASPPTVEA